MRKSDDIEGEESLNNSKSCLKKTVPETYESFKQQFE